MRLIDADRLSEIIGLRIKDYSRDSNGGAQKLAICYKELKNLIDNQPTAYDVDKVVEQLESEYEENVDSDTGEPCNNWAVDMQNDMIGKHIEIIRKGGMINRLD